MKKTLILIAFMLGLSGPSMKAQVRLTEKTSGKEVFRLSAPNRQTVIRYDANDATVVGKTAELLAADLGLVTGRQGLTTTGDTLPRNADVIIAGTIGQSALIDRLIAQRKIAADTIAGSWERYLIQTVAKPLPGVSEALVIAGSDRRGTSYGLLAVSDAIGVSPWYWWADVPVKPRTSLYLHVHPEVSKTPSVRYRGLFINDEDWGLLPWARHTFDPERGNIGPKTYAKVCELLLRLKANYLCPAMHEASTAFNKIPENKMVADSFAIVMGSVHCEPLLFNNASEWDRKTMGEWDYVKNKEGINSVLRRRVRENAAYENVYTLALRGLHDRAMTGSSDMKERVRQLEGALHDQRQLLVDELGKPGEEIPQAFTPYKEVLEVYSNGLELPDDVTIIWPDDNYGYMKRLSGERERKRSGRSGVYYHASYLGKPHDYLWISSTSPALMYEELRKAYDATADRIWLLNAGDIKACEPAVDLFLAMAYDIDRFDYANAADYQARTLSRIFGSQYYDTFREITATFYDLAFQRKPELMGWGYQWATDKHGRERNTDTDFSCANYEEASRRIAEYDRIGKLAEKVMTNLPEIEKPAFYQLLYYPVRASEQLNKMILDGQRNRWYARQGRAAANPLRDEVRAHYDSLQNLTAGYNELLGGKWNRIMTTRQGFACSYYQLPELDSVTLQSGASLGVWVESEDVLKGQRSFHALPAFSVYTRRTGRIDVFNKGDRPLVWTASPSDEWIRLDRTSGTTSTQQELTVEIDWEKVPVGERILGSVRIDAGSERETVLVSVFNPATPAPATIKGLYVEDNGCVSIPAAGFHRKFENEQVKMTLIENLGYEKEAVMMGHPLSSVQRTGGRNTPRLEYDFYSFSSGSVDVYTYMLPTFPLSADRPFAHETSSTETKYGVAIDEGPVMNPTTSSFEYAQAWYENVLKNCAVKKTTLHIDRPGRHTVKIICGDPGVVIQKIVLDFGGMKRSYAGPPPTEVIR